MTTKKMLDIEVKSIQMQPPILILDNTFKRVSKTQENYEEYLISLESYLRITAYKNTTIKTDQTFFDDSDMKSEYTLVVVYDKISGTPLLSARHYFEKSTILKFLKGDNNTETELIHNNEKFILDSFNDNIFLADRLSGNIKSAIYRQNRSKIFNLYYSEIVSKNKNCTLLLMVRKERGDKQLSKYLKMDFSIIGSTLHKGKEHTIIVRDLKSVSRI
jgi:hypothetical protein